MDPAPASKLGGAAGGLGGGSIAQSHGETCERLPKQVACQHGAKKHVGRMRAVVANVQTERQASLFRRQNEHSSWFLLSLSVVG